MQISSRITMVWYICNNYPIVNTFFHLSFSRASCFLIQFKSINRIDCNFTSVQFDGLRLVFHRSSQILTLRGGIIESQHRRFGMVEVRFFAPSLLRSFTPSLRRSFTLSLLHSVTPSLPTRDRLNSPDDQLQVHYLLYSIPTWSWIGSDINLVICRASLSISFSLPSLAKDWGFGQYPLQICWKSIRTRRGLCH